MSSLTNRLARRIAVAALCAGAAGCSDFLTGPGLTENPNAPIQAGAAQLIVSTQISLFNQQEGQLARIASMFTQQLSGTNNQQADYGSRYTINEPDLNTFWNQNYTGGGLTDLRILQAQAREGSDARLLGIAMTMEALRFGTATSIWGDIPYSEATGTNTKPALDPQQQVYAAVQARLDTAITQLRTVSTTAPTLATDLVYNGNATRWIKAANTLKARFHLHTAERLGAAAYTAAIAAANQGIDEAPTSATQAIDGQAPGDFRSFRGPADNVDANLWAQFLGARTDMTANQQFIELLQARNDPRLPRYFATASGGGYRGANQFGANAAGASVVATTPRLAKDFRQPIVTWSENQLILAEAKFQTGDVAGARVNLNNVRRAVGLPELAAVTLTDIMQEKYVTMFQNIEAWNDYKRTCVPRLTPGGANNTSAAEIPGRLIYPFSERNANPNIPAPSAQPARNWNDPNACA
jgi:hypothetical protein